MARHDDRISLRQMLDHAREALELFKNKSRVDLDQDRVCQLALMRLLEIVGEAAGRVSKATREAQPGLPWAQIVGMRNRLIHGYDLVDIGIMWDTLTSDLPALIAALEKILDDGK